MKNNFYNSCIMSAAILIITCCSGIMASADEPEFTLRSHVWGKRLLPNGVAGHDDAVVITEITASFDSGFYVYTMPYFDLKDIDMSSTGGDKLDAGIGWKGNIGGWADLDLALRYFNLCDLHDMPKGDIIQPHAEISKWVPLSGRQSFCPFISFDPHYPARGGQPKKGLIATGGFRHKWEINDRTVVNQRVNLIYDDGMCSFNSGTLFEYRFSIDHCLSESFSLQLPMLRVIEPITDGFSMKRSQAILGGGFTFYF